MGRSGFAAGVGGRPGIDPGVLGSAWIGEPEFAGTTVATTVGSAVSGRVVARWRWSIGD